MTPIGIRRNWRHKTRTFCPAWRWRRRRKTTTMTTWTLTTHPRRNISNSKVTIIPETSTINKISHRPHPLFSCHPRLMAMIGEKKSFENDDKRQKCFFLEHLRRENEKRTVAQIQRSFFWRFNSVSKSFQYFLIWTNAKDPFFSIRVQKKNSCSLKNDENRNFFRLTLTLTWTCLYLLLFGTEKIIKRLYQCRIIDVFHCCRQNFRVNSYHVTIYFRVVF